MDEDSLKNWGYYEPPVKGHLSLQLMSSVEETHTKPYVTGRENPIMVPYNGSYHPRDRVVTEPPVTHIDYVRDSWINHREKFLHMFPGNPYNPVLATSSGPDHPIRIGPVPTKETSTSIDEETVSEKESWPTRAKKRASSGPTSKTPKTKKQRKVSGRKEDGDDSDSPRRAARTEKKNVEVVINGIDMDITGVPIPICSCTGTPQQCYRWGCGGWQSACCTTTISMYPLPMSTKRRGARIAGRKMSQGAFKKVLEKLALEGYDFTNPIDLRTYWAKHGTNKFVIIR